MIPGWSEDLIILKAVVYESLLERNPDSVKKTNSTFMCSKFFFNLEWFWKLLLYWYKNLDYIFLKYQMIKPQHYP